MEYYRVSRNEHKVGEAIWEAEIGRNALTNILIGMGFIAMRDQASVQRIITAGAATAVKEAALEFIRQSNFPSFPSRYSNMMAFSELKDATFFRDTFRKDGGKIYALRIDGTPKFTGDMKMLDSTTDPDIDTLLQMATRYWNGEQTEDPIKETILDPSLKASIIEEI